MVFRYLNCILGVLSFCFCMTVLANETHGTFIRRVVELAQNSGTLIQLFYYVERTRLSLPEELVQDSKAQLKEAYPDIKDAIDENRDGELRRQIMRQKLNQQEEDLMALLAEVRSISFVDPNPISEGDAPISKEFQYLMMGVVGALLQLHAELGVWSVLGTIQIVEGTIQDDSVAMLRMTSQILPHYLESVQRGMRKLVNRAQLDDLYFVKVEIDKKYGK